MCATMTRRPPSGLLPSRQCAVKSRRPAPSTRRIAERSRHGCVPLTHPLSTTSLPLTELRTPRRSDTKSLKMLPPSATLSHAKSMSPKSENPTRPCTCARKLRLPRGLGQHAKKAHRVQWNVQYAKEPNVRRAAARSIGRSAGWPGAAWSIESIAALARNAAPESVRLNILRAKLKSAVPVFRDQSVKPSANYE